MSETSDSSSLHHHDDEDIVRTTSTTVASLWTNQQSHRRLLQKYLSDDLESVSYGSERHLEPPSTSFCRLNVATNLNPPPSNWLMSGTLGQVPPGVDQLSGFDPTVHSSGFSSFRMASHFLECLGLGKLGVDVVSDSENIKKLLKMPYSQNPVSLVVHRVGKTLLIDELDLHRMLLTSSEAEWKWLRNFLVEMMVENRDKAIVKRDKSRDAITERNLMSKFLYRSLNTTMESQENETETQLPQTNMAPDESIKPEDSANFFKYPSLPEPRPQDFEPKLKTPTHEFARTLLWNFEDIRMLIGSDMPIFGDSEHPSVSLRLHNMKQPINILTGLDYWLDNLMCQVPEVLMCYHLDGIVQKYELIKTEDLPKLSENGKFSPGIIRDVARNILAFLKSKAAKEGHTYWLFKGKDDDVVKLYDLTSLCEEAESRKSPTKNSYDSSKNNSFRTAVSMLLYKVARNILTGTGRKDEESNARQLLIKCLELLDKERFPYIATSAHYLLSDIFIPDDIDPTSVNEDESQDANESNPEPSNFTFDSRKRSCTTTTTAMVEIEALCKPEKMFGEDEKDGSPSPDQVFSLPPLTKSTKERCLLAIEHIGSGLKFLEVLAARRDEEEFLEKKRSEQHERDNPKMAKPNVAIPMPFAFPYESDRLIALKQESGVSEFAVVKDSSQLSWYDHLKTVLLRKTFLVYVTLAEHHFIRKEFGKVIRCIKRSINCRHMVRHLEGRILRSDLNSTLSFAYGIAGDAYLFIVQNWSNNIVSYIEQYNETETEAECAIAERIEQHVDSEQRDWLIKMPQDIEESLRLASLCLEKSLGSIPNVTSCTNGNERKSILKRLANVKNELGAFYMNQASSLARQLSGENLTAVKDLLLKSEQHLSEGIGHFETLGDDANHALLLSNMGRLRRMEAYCMSMRETDTCSELKEDKNSAEFSVDEANLYGQAIDCYHKALHILGQRKAKNAGIYDTITWELSTTHYTVGSQLQDFAPLSRKSRPEVVRQIADHYAKSLKYCEIERTEEKSRIPIYQYRSASVHARLANLYHFCHRAGSIESTGRPQHYRQLAENHYEKAVTLYIAVDDFNEILRCILEQVSLVEFQMDEGHLTKRHFVQVFQPFLGAHDVLEDHKLRFKEETSSGSDTEETIEREKLLKLFVQRCQQNLLGLNKFLSSSSKKQPAGKMTEKNNWAKTLYSKSLQLGASGATLNLVEGLCDFLQELAKEMARLK